MKRIVKRFLPILLSLVVICSIFWYLFSYDRGFMQDILITAARVFEWQGSHSVATWFYNQAYLHSGNDDEVIIELAERFKRIGNYTQAEVVLSDAIAEHASAELYVALSQTYVEQDKLLDAANMLENITDPQIKQRLDGLRPVAPVATPAPGFYSQYINVNIDSGHDAQLYVTTNGDFPSTGNHYPDEITLVGGENNIYAIAVGSNGLVSKPSYFGYTVGGVIEEVTISDPTLDALFRELLGVESDTQLFTNDLWKITSLTVPKGVENFSDLSHLTFLETLVIENMQAKGLQMLSSLTQLKTLTIRGCTLSANDVAVIGALPNLEILVLSDCSLTNIAGLSNATQLVTLDLSNNAIRDLSPLSFMNKLTTLDLRANALTNLSPLSALESLSVLDVSYNSLTSLAPLSSCSSLTGLIANNNQIAEFPVFQNTQVLTVLTLTSNNLTSVESISKYTNLTGLNIGSNQLTDISSLSSLKKLVAIDFSRNQVTTLPSWENDSVLVVLDGSHNKITSVAPLRGLPYLNDVHLDYNKITNINPLAECPMLVQVDVYGNSIKDVSKLTDMSVIVNYDPT